MNYKENFKFDQDERNVGVVGHLNNDDKGISFLLVKDDSRRKLGQSLLLFGAIRHVLDIKK